MAGQSADTGTREFLSYGKNAFGFTDSVITDGKSRHNRAFQGGKSAKPCPAVMHRVFHIIHRPKRHRRSFLYS